LLNPTVGVLIKNGDCVLEECRINNHIKGGIIIEGTKKNIVLVSKCKFYGNKEVHLEITGFNNKCLIEDNFFKGDYTETGNKFHSKKIPHKIFSSKSPTKYFFPINFFNPKKA